VWNPLATVPSQLLFVSARGCLDCSRDRGGPPTDLEPAQRFPAHPRGAACEAAESGRANRARAPAAGRSVIRPERRQTQSCCCRQGRRGVREPRPRRTAPSNGPGGAGVPGVGGTTVHRNARTLRSVRSRRMTMRMPRGLGDRIRFFRADSEGYADRADTRPHACCGGR